MNKIPRITLLSHLRRTNKKSTKRFNNYTLKIFEITKNLEITIPWAVEEEITDGLGYKPVREVMDEKHKDNEMGLMRHLANMDYVELARGAYTWKLICSANASAFGALEDGYIDLKDENEYLRTKIQTCYKENAILSDYLNDVYSGVRSLYQTVTDTLPPKPEKSKKQVSNKKHFVKRFFDFLYH